MFSSIKIALAKILTAPLLAMLALSGHPIIPSTTTTVIQQVQAPAPKLGAFNPTAAGTYFLEGGINTSATTLYLSSFVEPISNIPYTMPYLNSNIEYGVIDPNTPNRSEIISFTGITQNSDGSATITGVTRGLSRSYPFTASTTLAVTHAAQAQFILSDSPQVFAQYAAKQNNETITGQWSFPSPTSSSSPATEGFVLSTITGTSTLAFNKTVVAGTAGATVSAGQVLAFQTSTGQWSLATPTNSANTILGIAQGSGTSGVSISGGVLVKGLDANQSGLTSGATYFVSSTTPGSIIAATTTALVGKAANTTSIYFDPEFLNGQNSNNLFTGNNSFSTTTATSTIIGAFPAYNIGKNVWIDTTVGTTTFNVPSGIAEVWVRLVGAGGGAGGTCGSASASGGGGGGGYSEGPVNVSTTTSFPVVVAGGGPGGTTNACGTALSGQTASTTYFGNPSSPFMQATGGLGSGGANSNASDGGVGGVGSLGTINLTGENGFNGYTPTSNLILGQPGLAPFGGMTYGNGGTGTTGNNNVGGAGNQGIVIVTW